MNTTTIHLMPLVRFREFPFGTIRDPSMREAMAQHPWEHQGKVLEYLRSGHILGLPMGADLPDWFDPPHRANPTLDGRMVGGVTPMTDGAWSWPAGLIHFIEKYNVHVPEEFIRHAAGNNWQVNKEVVSQFTYAYDY